MILTRKHIKPNQKNWDWDAILKDLGGAKPERLPVSLKETLEADIPENVNLIDITDRYVHSFNPPRWDWDKIQLEYPELTLSQVKFVVKCSGITIRKLAEAADTDNNVTVSAITELEAAYKRAKTAFSLDLLIASKQVQRLPVKLLATLFDKPPVKLQNVAEQAIKQPELLVPDTPLKILCHNLFLGKNLEHGLDILALPREDIQNTIIHYYAEKHKKDERVLVLELAKTFNVIVNLKDYYIPSRAR